MNESVLKGKTALVTGASSGLGVVSPTELASKAAILILWPHAVKINCRRCSKRSSRPLV